MNRLVTVQWELAKVHVLPMGQLKYHVSPQIISCAKSHNQGLGQKGVWALLVQVLPMGQLKYHVSPQIIRCA